MQIAVQHIPVHTSEQVREIINEASVIAAEMTETDAAFERTFNKACDLLGQRYTLAVQPESLGLDLSQLRATG